MTEGKDRAAGTGWTATESSQRKAGPAQNPCRIRRTLRRGRAVRPGNPASVRIRSQRSSGGPGGHRSVAARSWFAAAAKAAVPTGRGRRDDQTSVVCTGGRSVTGRKVSWSLCTVAIMDCGTKQMPAPVATVSKVSSGPWVTGPSGGWWPSGRGTPRQKSCHAGVPPLGRTTGTPRRLRRVRRERAASRWSLGRHTQRGSTPSTVTCRPRVSIGSRTKARSTWPRAPRRLRRPRRVVGR